MSRWWKRLTDDDPISLEPLCELEVPPFQLSSGPHYFDAHVLSHYIVSQGRFENPTNRHPLTREDCLKLDTHLRSHKEHGQAEHDSTTVTLAYDLQQTIRVRGGDASEAAEARALVLRREATAALYSLFEYRGIGRRSKRRSDKTAQSRTGWRVFDDDEGEEMRDEGTVLCQPCVCKQTVPHSDAFPQLSEMADEVARVRAQTAGQAFLLTARAGAGVLSEEEQRRLAAKQQAENIRVARLEERKQRSLEAQQRAAQQEREAAATAEESLLVSAEKAEAAAAEAAEWFALELEASRERERALRARQERDAKAAAELASKRQAEAELAAQQEKRKEQELLEQLATKKEKEKAKKKQMKKNASAKKQEARRAEQDKQQEEQRLTQEAAARAAAANKCFHCKTGVLGPGFELFDHKFCSMPCLRAHREQA